MKRYVKQLFVLVMIMMCVVLLLEIHEQVVANDTQVVGVEQGEQGELITIQQGKHNIRYYFEYETNEEGGK